MALRFHWMLPKSGEVGLASVLEAAQHQVRAKQDDSPAARPEMTGWLEFGRRAEALGIDSLLISFSRYEPDPALVACALGRETERLGFILAARSGLMAPAMLVQQLDTLAWLLGDGRRVSLNLVAGSSPMEQRGYGDFLGHDDRYARADEFLAVSRALWQAGDSGDSVDFEGAHYRIAGGRNHTTYPGARGMPEIYVSGHSHEAMQLATRRASCWLRVVDRPEVLRDAIERARAHGLDVCLRASVICRPTRAEALAVVEQLLGDPIVAGTRSSLDRDARMFREAGSGWLSPCIWAGLAPIRGPVWTTLVGTPDELAASMLEYASLGVGQFILSGWPELDELEGVAREVIPRVRAAEARG